MPFGVVSGVGRGMGLLDGSAYRRREGAVLGVKLEHPIVTNGYVCDCMWVSFDPRERTICGLATVAP